MPNRLRHLAMPEENANELFGSLVEDNLPSFAMRVFTLHYDDWYFWTNAVQFGQIPDQCRVWMMIS
jgi:hypothetical protein